MPPLFQWLQHRSAGILLHPTSLPGSTGIGTFGREARHFVDFLADAGIKNWQVCPLGPTGFGDSPYQCFSAFAGNPYFIDPETLIGHGLLEERDLADLEAPARRTVSITGLSGSSDGRSSEKPSEPSIRTPPVPTRAIS